MAQSAPRSPIDVVRRQPPASRARIGGRVVGAAEGAALVQDVTGSLEVRCQPAPLPGAWVVCEGLWDGARLIEAACQVVSVPDGPFPRPDGDFAWAHAAGGHRLRNLRARASVLRAVRAFFDQRAFTEVETPLAVPSPGLDLHLDALEVVGAGAPRWLGTSPEYQMKRLLAAGLPRIYQVSRCFRRGELGQRHHPEFTMLEWYRSFAGMHEIMRDTEDLVAHVARALHDGTTVVPAQEGLLELAPPWERLTLREAFDRYAGMSLDAALASEELFFRMLSERVEPQLGRGRPTFLTGWPASMASLARLDPQDPSVAERVEAFVDGMELSNGFSELIDAREQRARLLRDQAARAAEGKAVYPVDERFLGALAEGIPPSGGNALGVDRLVMLVLGARHIDDVVAIPPARL
jgi:lysyl-tRNA synthetase class 2